jgi:hypothetical protein
VTPIVLRRVVLTPAHKPTGNTLHVGMPVPSELRIVRHDGQQGFWLLYCDASGQELTDTWHQTLEDALHQAEFEFTVKPAHWDVGVAKA